MINIHKGLVHILLALIIGYSFGGLTGLGIAASIMLAIRAIIIFFHEW